MKHFKTHRSSRILLCAIAAALFVQQASALTLRFQDIRYDDAAVLSSFLIQDNGAGDSDLNIGSISYQGSIWGYNISANAAVLAPWNNHGVIQRGTVTAVGPENTAKDNVLQITASETNFVLNPPQTPQGTKFSVEAGQWANFNYWGENICFRGQADAQNSAFGTSVFGGDAEFVSKCGGDDFAPGENGVLRDSAFVELIAGQPFSVISDVQIVRAANNEFPGTRLPLSQGYTVATFVVPLPAALPLSFVGLAAIGFASRRRRKVT